MRYAVAVVMLALGFGAGYYAAVQTASAGLDRALALRCARCRLAVYLEEEEGLVPPRR